MKILIVSNHPKAGTGYGSQTALAALALRDHGHDVAVFANWGVNVGLTEWKGIRVYPGGLDGYGNDVAYGHATHWFDGQPGVVIVLYDAFVLDANVYRQLPTAVWAPVDHDPAPKIVVDFFEQSGAAAIAMSKFGVRAFAEQQLAPLYVPHAVDTDVFQEIDRAEARRAVGNLPEQAFVIGMVAANKGFPARKGFPEAFEAFARFAGRHDDAMLYVHSHPHQAMGGVSMPALLAAHGVPTERVVYADPYVLQTGVPTSFMPNVYSSMDVFLNAAYGEGFGVPIIEAQACGTPVIVTDWTAMSELVGPGWAVEGQRQWTEQASFRMTPSVDAIERALEQAYLSAPRRRPWARDFAVDYDIRTVADRYWKPAVAELARRFEAVEIGAPSPPLRRGRPLIRTSARSAA